MEYHGDGLAHVLRTALGAQWWRLHPDIRTRFVPAAGTTRQSFAGIMDVVDRSPFGWWIARLLAFARVLPATRTRNTPFEFNLSPAPGVAAGWIKQRVYHFDDGPFEFRSVMHHDAGGNLVEQFPCGLGMKIRLGIEGRDGDTLCFRDDGYFLRVAALRVPLPRWLGVGHFTLMHRNVDREHFTVDIRIDHPLCGRLFHQHGRFHQTRSVRVPGGGGAVRPAPERKAIRETACC